MKIRNALFYALLATLPGAQALAAPVPQLPSDPRIKLLMYDEADVYTITAKYGYQTNVVFAPYEEIQTISVGDRSLWQIIPAGNRMFIRPMEENVITNMTVLTNRRSYQFDLKSIEGDKGDNIYVAQFVYNDKKLKAQPAMEPAEPAPVAAASEPQPAPPSVPAVVPAPALPAPAAANYNYTFSGPDELAPIQVYDDGKSTYIKYQNPYQPLPNAYMVGPDGEERLTTVYQRDKVMVIDAIAGQWVLRNSNGAIIIYNEMLNPR